MKPPTADHKQGQEGQNICPICGKNIVVTAPTGALSAMLFPDRDCQCSATETANFDGDKTQTTHLAFQSSDTVISGNMPKKLRQLRRTHEGITFTRPDEQAAAKVIGLVDGAIIGGIYRISKMIGRGGMGEVYLAEHMTLEKKCALKIIPPEQVTDIGWQRFQTEAKAIAKLDHVNLIKVSDLGIHEGCLPFYAMEYVDGKTLEEVLAEDKTLPLQTALEIFIQLCDGLDYAHRNSVVHRDIKPANIMLTRGPNGRYAVKILDFGLAKLTQQDKHRQRLTSVGEVCGSPHYMSPEQCGADKVDNRSDIYSLGCTLFETLTGRPPFPGRLAAVVIYSHQETEPPSLESVVGSKRFPEALEVVMAKLLRKNPVERYQTMAELHGDLEKIIRGEGVLPFYMSRTRDAAAELSSSRIRIVTAEDLAEEDDDQELPVIARPPLVVWTLVFSLIVGLVGAFWYYTQHKSQTVVTPALTSVTADLKGLTKDGDNVFDVMTNVNGPTPGESDKATPPPSAKETTPFSTIVVQNKMRFRRFIFPIDMCIGQIRSFAQQYEVSARGILEFRERDPVHFVPDSILAKYPSYFKRFQPGDIYCISIANSNNSDAVLKAACAVPAVAKLAIYRCASLTSEGLKSIESYDHLVDLDCSYNRLDVSNLSKLSRLGELKALRLSGEKNIAPVIKKLDNSQALKELYLDDCQITPEMLKTLASLPHLATLSLNGDRLSDDDLTILSKSPSLHFLSVLKTPVTPKTAAIIKSFAALKVLQIVAEPNASAVSPRQLLDLQHALSTLKVY